MKFVKLLAPFRLCSRYRYRYGYKIEIDMNFGFLGFSHSPKISIRNVLMWLLFKRSTNLHRYADLS